MKLYIWDPQSHGEHTLYIVAPSEDTARSLADQYVAKHPHDFHGWGTDHYELTVAEPFEVVTHAND
jgi:hypothetical protein